MQNNNKIFPSEIAEFTAQHHFSKFSVTTQAIYTTIILLIVGIGIAAPYVFLDITVKGTGIIRPKIEKTEIKSLVSGQIETLYIKNNQPVMAASTLLVIASDALAEKKDFNKKRTVETLQFLNDLTWLLKTDSKYLLKHKDSIITPMYSQGLLQFYQQMVELNKKYKNVNREYRRDLKLYRKKVIARDKYESKKFERDMVKSEMSILFERQINTWQTAFNQYSIKLTELETQQAQFEKEQEYYTIKAPITGTIQNFVGLQEGSLVFPNQAIAEISPDSNLLIETYIKPNDIGLIKKGMPVHLQIDAYNYNQWGLASGQVIEISNDILIMNEQPIFKVKCSLDQSFLSLKNGYKGNLKKGMTSQVRFIVTKRSLYQLLYDKVDDWINPMQN